MSEVSRDALTKLLRQIENAACRDGADVVPTELPRRATRLLFSPGSLPQYEKIRTHAEKAACNGSLQLAERSGAIRIEWDPRADDRSQVLAIEAVGFEALARLLGVAPRWNQLKVARDAFAPLMARHPVLDELVRSWAQEGAPRKSRLGAEGVKDWLDSAAVVDWARKRALEGTSDDIAMRRLSTILFSDSKRLEDLAGLVDILTQGELGGLVRDTEEVFKELGIAKFPSPFLVGAPGMSARCGDLPVPCPRPYLGLASSSITGFALDAARAAAPVVLSVENLTTFHELCPLVPPQGILLYTGGMPSPSWLGLYRVLLAALPPGAAVWHWGDIDGGGFRIANRLAMSCAEAGRTLLLHSMAVGSALVRRAMAEAEVGQVASICERWGWGQELAFVAELRVALEQEGMSPSFPGTAAPM
jgi:hypothetical protein